MNKLLLLMSILLFMEDVMAAKSSLLRTKSRFSTSTVIFGPLYCLWKNLSYLSLRFFK